MGPILEAVRTQNSEQAQDWSHSEHWATVEQLIAASLSSPPQSRPQSVAFAEVGAVGGGTDNSENGLVRGNDHPATSQADPGPLWTCSHCTYLNPAELGTCEMCSLPRQTSRLSQL
jgi:nuclear protein localization family protein 4